MPQERGDGLVRLRPSLRAIKAFPRARARARARVLSSRDHLGTPRWCLRRGFGVPNPLAPGRCALLKSEINFAWNTKTKTRFAALAGTCLETREREGGAKGKGSPLGTSRCPGVSPLCRDRRSVGRHSGAERPARGTADAFTGWCPPLPRSRLSTLGPACWKDPRSRPVATRGRAGDYRGRQVVKRAPKNRRANRARGEIKSRHGAG
jgi:hypothetical protein